MVVVSSVILTPEVIVVHVGAAAEPAEVNTWPLVPNPDVPVVAAVVPKLVDSPIAPDALIT